MKRLPLLLLPLLAALAVAMQNTPSQTNPAVPTVSFDCLWEAATPQEYTVTTRSDGSSTYLSRNPVAPKDPNVVQDPDYQFEFTMSPANSKKVFKLAEQAHFFNGNFEFTKHVMANTGKKTLTYSDPARHYRTVYNYSENKAIQDLTSLFQGISLTLEHGRKLQFKHKYDKLGLEQELKATEDEAQNRNLAELQLITPVLESIADDPSVLNIARERAKRLLGKSK